VVLSFLVLAFVVMNLRWISLFRQGQPLDIDEAGYLSIAFSNYLSLLHEGFFGWIAAIESSGFQAPLTTALSSLIFSITKPEIFYGFFVPLFAGSITIISTYLLGSSLASTSVGVICAVLVASTPIIVNYARSFHFALPATAIFTLALVAILRSHRFTYFGWSSIFGICVGLLPLARTMTLAFLPGLLMAAFWVALWGGQRKRSSVLLLWALLIGLLTALTWYGKNGSAVFQYLFHFGYGSRAVEFGQKSSLLNFSDWLDMARTFIAYVYLPHFCILMFGLAALFFVGGRKLATTDRTSWWELVQSRPLPILICVAEAVLALISSRNKGSAFIAPIVPAAITLAVFSIYMIKNNAIYHRIGAAIACLVATFALTPLIDLRWPTARPISFDFSNSGPMIVSDGRGTIQLYEAAAGFASLNPAEPIGQAAGFEWVKVSETAAIAIERQGGQSLITAFGFRHYMYNVNTVNLQHLQAFSSSLDLRQVEPIITGANIAGYVSWLTEGDARQVCLLLTYSGDQKQFVPVVRSSDMQSAAQLSNFVPVDRWTLPDSENVTLWRRSRENCKRS
jgi:4-amino-4-deoxy-L-arabinose transferase-like glycosyltransferase